MLISSLPLRIFFWTVCLLPQVWKFSYGQPTIQGDNSKSFLKTPSANAQFVFHSLTGHRQMPLSIRSFKNRLSINQGMQIFKDMLSDHELKLDKAFSGIRAKMLIAGKRDVMRVSGKRNEFRITSDRDVVAIKGEPNDLPIRGKSDVLRISAKRDVMSKARKYDVMSFAGKHEIPTKEMTPQKDEVISGRLLGYFLDMITSR